jgi:hypothetical protein
LSESNNNTTITDNVPPQLVQFFGVIAAIVGAVLLAIGIGYIAMSYGKLAVTISSFLSKFGSMVVVTAIRLD